MLIGALEAGGTKMVCSIGNPQGGVLQRASFPTLTPDVTVPQIVDFIGKFDVKALGIGSFGPLDLNPASPTYGSITKTPKKEWIQYPLMTTLKDALGVPTGIDTDVNAAALAEYTMGAGKGRGSLLYVTVGTGIGGGLYCEDRLVHGMLHPEWGHMLLAPRADDPTPEAPLPPDPAKPTPGGPTLPQTGQVWWPVPLLLMTGLLLLAVGLFRRSTTGDER